MVHNFQRLKILFICVFKWMWYVKNDDGTQTRIDVFKSDIVVLFTTQYLQYAGNHILCNHLRLQCEILNVNFKMVKRPGSGLLWGQG